MTKKIGILIIVVLLLIIGGVLWWKWATEFPALKPLLKNIYVKSTGYEIKDTPEGKIIENKKEGLTVKVPEEWIVKKYEEEIGLFSPEIEFDQYGGFLKSMREKGACGIGIEIFKSKKVNPELTTYAEDLRDLIKKLQGNPMEEETVRSEVITVSNKLTLKESFLREGKEKYISVEIPVNETVYSFTSGLIFSEKCVQEFNEFLEDISIK